MFGGGQGPGPWICWSVPTPSCKRIEDCDIRPGNMEFCDAFVDLSSHGEAETGHAARVLYLTCALQSEPRALVVALTAHHPRRDPTAMYASVCPRTNGVLCTHSVHKSQCG